MLLDRKVVLKRAQEVFFDAMLDGYCGKMEKSTLVLSNNGHTKTITYADGDYRLVDEYHTNPYSDKSSGTTTIFFQDIPVWWMSYGGYYHKKVVPFLKETLRSMYEKRTFYFGRGPSSATNPSNGTIYEYKCNKNIPMGREEIHDFEYFSGTEEICELVNPYSPSEHRIFVGYHHLSGMNLI